MKEIIKSLKMGQFEFVTLSEAARMLDSQWTKTLHTMASRGEIDIFPIVSTGNRMGYFVFKAQVQEICDKRGVVGKTTKERTAIRDEKEQKEQEELDRLEHEEWKRQEKIKQDAKDIYETVTTHPDGTMTCPAWEDQELPD